MNSWCNISLIDRNLLREISKLMTEEINSRNTAHYEVIMQATLEILSEKSISGSRTREIAKRAGMSQGNLHYYFPAKDSLFLALLDHLGETFIEGRKSKLTDASLDPATKLNCFLEQEKELILQQPSLLKVWHDFWVQGIRNPEIGEKIEGMYDSWRSDIEAVVAEGVRQGLFDNTYAPLIPNLLVALMQGAAQQYLIDSNNVFDLEAYFDAAHKMVLWLLRGPNGNESEK